MDVTGGELHSRHQICKQGPHTTVGCSEKPCLPLFLQSKGPALIVLKMVLTPADSQEIFVCGGGENAPFKAPFCRQVSDGFKAKLHPGHLASVASRITAPDKLLGVLRLLLSYCIF
jgi:hypothetical protein